DRDGGGRLEVRHAHLAAAQIGGGIDPPVVADIDRRMAEGTGDESGNPDIGALSPRRRHQMGAEGELGDVEFAVTEGALEDLLRMNSHMGDLAALDRDPPIEKRAGAVIALTGKRQLQHHEPLSSSAAGGEKPRPCPGPSAKGSPRARRLPPARGPYSNAFCSSLGAAAPAWLRSASAVSMRCLPFATWRKLTS